MGMMNLPDGKAVEKNCPDCEPIVKLIIRTNKKSGNQFLGCPNWPECEHTEPIPEHIIMEFMGQERLL